MHFRLFAALIAMTTIAIPAFACTPPRGYRVPMHMKLVASADVIVIGVVKSGPGMNVVQPDEDPRVVVHPIRTLKGHVSRRSLAVFGAVTSVVVDDRNSLPELENAHPSSYMGGCVRDTFTRGTRIVLFLRKDAAGELRMMQQPFARVAEDATSAWIDAVQAYTRISAHPHGSWDALLRGHRAALMTSRKPNALALAKDIDREIAGIEPGSSPDAKRRMQTAIEKAER